MLYDLKIVKIFAFVLLAVVTTAAQTAPVVLQSPNGALDISIATVRGQSVGNVIRIITESGKLSEDGRRRFYFLS